jgi:hypothetical protein
MVTGVYGIGAQEPRRSRTGTAQEPHGNRAGTAQDAQEQGMA